MNTAHAEPVRPIPPRTGRVPVPVWVAASALVVGAVVGNVWVAHTTVDLHGAGHTPAVAVDQARP